MSVFDNYVNVINKELKTSYNAKDFNGSTMKLASKMKEDGVIGDKVFAMVEALDKTSSLNLIKSAGFLSNVKKNMSKNYDDNKFLTTLLAANFGLGLASQLPTMVSTIKEEVRDAVTDDYQEMLKEHPNLVESDGNQQRNIFGVLEQFSPSVARNPYLAGNYVRDTMHNMGNIGTNEVATLTNIERAQGSRGSLQESLNAVKTTLAPAMLLASGMASGDPESTQALVDTAISLSPDVNGVTSKDVVGG